MGDWTQAEESAFDAILEAGGGVFDRLEAIRMLRRARGDVDKALLRAKECREVAERNRSRFARRGEVDRESEPSKG